MPSPQRKMHVQGGTRARSPLGSQATSDKTEHHVPVTLVSASHRVISRALHHAIDSSGDEGSDDNMLVLPLAGPPIRATEEHDSSVSSSLSSVLPVSTSSNSLKTASADMLAASPSCERQANRPTTDQPAVDKRTEHRSKKRIVYAPALQARQARLKQQLEQYLHLTVVLPFASSAPLRLLTHKTASIEQLARQIEAEYALSNASLPAPLQAKETTDSVTSLNLADALTSACSTIEPLEVGLLHDPNQTPLLFSSLVGQVLENNSVVHAVNIARRSEEELPRFKSHAAHECHTLASQWPSDGAESDAPTPDYATARPSFHLPSMGHHEQHYQALTARLAGERQAEEAPLTTALKDALRSIDEQPETPSNRLFGDCRRLYFPRQPEGQATSTDDIAQAVLHHGLGIQHFEKFCVSRFYVEALLFFLDCELFRKSQEEMTTLVVQARYIYLTYVRPNSPLEVNIPSDVRKAVPWPIDAKNLDQSILLETQFYVYEFLRTFAIPRFVQSADYQQMIDEMDNDPHAFAKGWLLKSLTSYYSSDPDSMLQSLTTMNETSSDMLAADVPRERRPSALGLMQKEEYLNAAIDKFWKNDRRASVTSGYFKQEHHLSTAQKNKRIRTEKKLSKFFGERPEIHILADKLQEDAEAPSEGTQHEIQALLGQMIDTTVDADQPLTMRRKKLEKLEEFFGDRLGDMQLIEQRLMLQDRLQQQLKQQQQQAAPTNGLKQHGSKEMLRVPPVTTNDISLMDRKVLTKRVHKVQDILGQTLQEDEIKHSITNPHRAFGSTENLAERVALPLSPTGRSRSSTMPSFLAATGSTSPTSASPPHTRGHDFSRYRHERAQSNTTATTSDSEVASLQTVDVKEMRRRKLEKIQQFLGEMIPLTDLLEVPAKANGPSAKEPLSDTEKRHGVKRSEKLNKWFGKQPPAELQSTFARHRQSIISLGLIMQSSDTVLNLLEYLDNQEGGGEEEDTRKTMHRRRKMNKLTRFFGDKPRGEELIEQDILSLLEQEINDEVPEKDGRSELKADLLSLRKQLKRISADITSATSAFAHPHDAKKMVMVNFPIGLPDEDEVQEPKTLQRAATSPSAQDNEHASLVTAGDHTLGSAFQMGSTATVLIGNATSLPEVDKSVSLYTTRSMEQSISPSTVMPPPPPQLSAVSYAMSAMMPRSFSTASTGSTGSTATYVVPEELLTPSSSFHNQEISTESPAVLPHVSQLRPSSSRMRERSSSASRLRSRLGL